MNIKKHQTEEMLKNFDRNKKIQICERQQAISIPKNENEVYKFFFYLNYFIF